MEFFLNYKLHSKISQSACIFQFLPSRHFVTFLYSMGNLPFQGNLIYKVLEITMHYWYAKKMKNWQLQQCQNCGIVKIISPVQPEQTTILEESSWEIVMN